jgi:Asp/Glu/hydantoin racemase
MKKARIELITPIITEGIRTLDEVEPFFRPDLVITQSLIKVGPASIERIRRGDLRPRHDPARDRRGKEGADAIIIDCMGDPGLRPAARWSRSRWSGRARRRCMSRACSGIASASSRYWTGCGP